jgi:hypothetical protein
MKANEDKWKEDLAAQRLRSQWCNMFSTLAMRASSIVQRIRGDTFCIPMADDDAAFLLLFTKIAEKVEEVAANMDQVI